MTEFSEGDLIEATKGDTVIRGRVSSTGVLVETGRSLQGLREQGFTLTPIEKAAPALPTEPGFYLDGQGDVWRLTTSGNWSCPTAPSEDGHAKTYAPFTRLEPVADTAKKVLDAVREEVQDCDHRQCNGLFTRDHLRALVQNLEAEFGVTS